MKKIVIITMLIIVGVVFFVVQKREQADKENRDLQVDSNDLIRSMNGEPLKTRVPNIRLKSLDAEEIALSDYRGSVLFLSIWHSQCPVCQKEAPHLKALAKHFTNNPKLQFVGISIDEDVRKAKQFVSQYKLPFTNFHDTKGKAINRTSLQIKGTPSVFIISSDGYIIGRFSGLHEWSEKTTINTLKTLVSQF